MQTKGPRCGPFVVPAGLVERASCFALQSYLYRETSAAAAAARISHGAAAAGAALPGGGAILLAGRIAGGAGLSGLAALVLHLVAGRIAGCAGLAGRRALVLHALARRLILGRALRVERAGSEQQAAGGDDR